MKVISSFRSKRGFTLTEMMVSIGILSIIGLALSVITVQSIKGWSFGASRAQADNTTSLVIHKLWQDVREGSSATVINDGEELRVTVPTLITDAYGENYYDTDSAGTVHRYYLSGSTLYRQIGAGTATPYAENIVALSFSTTGGTVSVTVTSQNRIGASQSEEECIAKYGSHHTLIALRNFRS